MNANEIGVFLSDLRKRKGLKQKEVAEAIQVSDKAISRWETGRGIPDVGSLQNLSDFYEVSINEILAGRFIKEEEVKKTADQNIKELVKQKISLKKKLTVAIIGIISLLILLGLGMMPIPTVGIAYDVSDGAIDKVFQDIADLENANIEYSIVFDTHNKCIMVQIEDYRKYEEFAKSSY